MKYAVILLALIGALAFSNADAGPTMRDCPQQGQWALSVWDGKDGADAGEALGTCGNVTAAYVLNPDGSWLRWLGNPGEFNSLHTVDYMQGVIAFGGGGVPEEADMEDLYGRATSELLPDLSNDASHALTMRGVGPANPGTGKGKPPTSVEAVGNGDVEVTWTRKTLYPYEEVCFYWNGEKLGPCTPAPRLLGCGYEYTISLYLGADQTYEVGFETERQIVYLGRGKYGHIRCDPANIPFNPTCPTGTWEKPCNNCPITCPGFPDAEFGLFQCEEPPEGEEFCSIDD